MTKQIPLTQGLFALVDDDVYEELNQYKWYAQKSRRTVYASRRTHNKKQTTALMHRTILGLSPGDGKITDHRNRDGLDNRLSNLRTVSKSVNGHNHSGYSSNTSGHTGVGWHTRYNKWHAYIVIDCKKIHLGVYDNLRDAIEARRQGELAYW